MVMLVTINNKAPKEVAFEEWNSLKGKGSQKWQEKEKKFMQMMVNIVKELQKVEEPAKLPTILKPSWST